MYEKQQEDLDVYTWNHKEKYSVVFKKDCLNNI